MKKMAKLICLITCITAIFTACAPRTDDVMKKYENKQYLFLVAGFDDAAENTDVLFTMSYDKASDITRIAQIPRDTYYNFGGTQNKINQYFATKRQAGEDKSTAMKSTADMISQLFDVTFDGYIGISTAAFRRVVDAIGGIDIEVPADMNIAIDGEEPLLLKKGSNLIDGAGAEQFVRYRSGYIMGDLGRIDAQKMFLNALFGKISKNLTLPTILKIAGVFRTEAVTDFKLSTITALLLDNANGSGITYYATVPGEPTVSETGVSYYVLNRKSASELARIYMFSGGNFDPERRCFNKDSVSFTNIYEDDGFSIKEYVSDEVKGLRIK